MSLAYGAAPVPSVLGMTVRVYQDPLQEQLTQIFNSTSKSDLEEVQRIVTGLSRRRLLALPLDLSPLTDACEWAVDDLSLRGMPEAASSVREGLTQLVAAATTSTHPLPGRPDPEVPRTVLVPDDLFDEFVDEARPPATGAADQVLTVSEWRDLLDAPGPSGDVEDWLQAARDGSGQPPAVLLGWPNNYYLRHWFENHAWLWFAPVQSIHVPAGLVKSLEPRLWVATSVDPSAGWARSMNARMRRQAAAATRARLPEDEAPEGPLRVYSRDWSRTDYVEVHAHGTSENGRRWLRRLPSYEAQIWDPDAKELKTVHFPPGTVIEEPVTLIHFRDREPWEVNRDLGSWANPFSHEISVWKAAANRALAASSLETDRSKIKAVASGKQIRFQGVTRNEALYRDLCRFGDDEFRRLFPDFRRTRRLLTKWHAAQSLAGKEGVKNLELALETLGPDAPQITQLVHVLHCTRLEITALSGGDASA